LGSGRPSILIPSTYSIHHSLKHASYLQCHYIVCSCTVLNMYLVKIASYLLPRYCLSSPSGDQLLICFSWLQIILHYLCTRIALWIVANLNNNNNNGLFAGHEWYLCFQRFCMGLEKWWWRFKMILHSHYINNRNYLKVEKEMQVMRGCSNFDLIYWRKLLMLMMLKHVQQAFFSAASSSVTINLCGYSAASCFP
jgi:hypothetical protein